MQNEQLDDCTCTFVENVANRGMSCVGILALVALSFWCVGCESSSVSEITKSNVFVETESSESNSESFLSSETEYHPMSSSFEVEIFEMSSSEVDAFESSSSMLVFGVMTDERNGKKYKTVEIDGNVWMAENLDYEIPGYKAYCNENNPDNCIKYGRNYDWNAAMGASVVGCKISDHVVMTAYQGICPEGWHIPSYSEWKRLVAYAGDSSGVRLKSKEGWVDGAGTDDYGFSALPSGEYYPSFRRYVVEYGIAIGYLTCMWSSSGPGQMFTFSHDAYYVIEGSGPRGSPHCMVRCIKGQGIEAPCDEVDTIASIEPTGVSNDSIVDTRDGKVYRTVKIGNYVWMAENLDYADSASTQNLVGNTACGAKSNFENESDCETFGRLYTWFAAMDVDEEQCVDGCTNDDEVYQGICPTGFHLPTKVEIEILLKAVGAVDSDSMLLDKSFCGKPGHCTDEFGFSARLPISYIDSSYYERQSGSLIGNFWSSTENVHTFHRMSAYSLQLVCLYMTNEVGLNYMDFGAISRVKEDLSFVRCVRKI